MIGLHLFIQSDVGKAENKFFRVALQLVADVLHFAQQVIHADMVG